MAYEDASNNRECTGGFGAHRCYFAEMDVFGAIGNSEELPARYHAAVSQNLEQLEMHVGGQGVVEEWQSGATTSGSVSLEWAYTEGLNPMLYTHTDGSDSTFHGQLATPYNVEQVRSGNTLPDGPWSSLGLPDHRSDSAHPCNATPSISIVLSTGERTVGSLRHGAFVSYCHSVATALASQASCAVASQHRIQDQSTLHVSTTKYDQSPPLRRWLGESVESASSYLSEKDTDYAATSAEIFDGQYHNNLFNVPCPQQVQHGLPIRTPASDSPLATSMSRTSSTQRRELLYCHEPGCSANFKGLYAKGNLARHRRLKHSNQQGEGAREYSCEEPGCSKSYQRQDARVKHYRKHHPHLAPGPALSRKKYQSV